jgi:3-oxoadipate enol-lactonase
LFNSQHLKKLTHMSTHYIHNLAVEIQGEGMPVVCLQGLGGTSNTWTPVLSALLAFKVIRIDLPGSARSSTAASGSELSIVSMADAVLAVCKQLGVTNAHFLGHSMGTIVCQHIATKKPHLIKSMVLFGPLACAPVAAQPHIEARAEKAISGGVIAMQEIADAIVQGATSASSRDHLPVAIAMVRESLMRQNPQDYGKSCRALARAQSAALEDISVPVLLVTGDEDAVAPPSTVAVMQQRLPNARTEVLSRCGHWTTFERPVECAQLIRDFLKN